MYLLIPLKRTWTLIYVLFIWFCLLHCAEAVENIAQFVQEGLLSPGVHFEEHRLRTTGCDGWDMNLSRLPFKECDIHWHTPDARCACLNASVWPATTVCQWMSHSLKGSRERFMSLPSSSEVVALPSRMQFSTTYTSSSKSASTIVSIFAIYSYLLSKTDAFSAHPEFWHIIPRMAETTHESCGRFAGRRIVPRLDGPQIVMKQPLLPHLFLS